MSYKVIVTDEMERLLDEHVGYLIAWRIILIKCR